MWFIELMLILFVCYGVLPGIEQFFINRNKDSIAYYYKKQKNIEDMTKEELLNELAGIE